MIRTALPRDKTRVVELLRESHDAAGFDNPEGVSGFVFPFEPEYAENLFLQHLRALDCLCIVDDDGHGVAQGVLMAAIYQHKFGPVRLANETVWYITPIARGRSAVRMLDQYETWAVERGAVFAGMAGMGDDPLVGKLYERRGYKRAETHFLKAVS